MQVNQIFFFFLFPLFDGINPSVYAVYAALAES